MNNSEKIEKIEEILQKTEKKLIADNTDTPIKSDYNDCVDATAIALRELMIYGDFSSDIKNKMKSILITYGSLFNHDYTNFEQSIEDAELLMPDINWAEGIKFMKHPLCINDKDIFELIIKEILLRYWQDYIIPSSTYDRIEYSHVNEEINACDSFKHHYKCLKDKSLNWNDLNQKYEYELEITEKEIKEMALNARDSGGNSDYAGYAHIGTTMNVVCCFLEDKFDLDYEWQWEDKYEDAKELHQMADEIYDIVCSAMGEYMIELY